MIHHALNLSDYGRGPMPEVLPCDFKTPGGREYIRFYPVGTRPNRIHNPHLTPAIVEPVEEFAEQGWANVAFMDGHVERVQGHFRHQQELYDVLLARCSGECRAQVESFIQELKKS
jgi:prepilin-type processing-associated H-X9-DG protein